MWLLASGILAELNLRKPEEIIIRMFKNIIAHLLRYVDDIFATLKDNCIIENLTNEFISIDKNIKFTRETENNKK